MPRVLGGDGEAHDGADVGYLGAQKATAWLSGRSPRPEGISGRLFVVVGCLSVLLIWGGLSFVFARWKANHEALVAFGKAEVAPTVEPLASLTPKEIDRSDWEQAVADSRTMLIALTSAGLLDRASMSKLRDDIKGKVSTATKESAIAVLTWLWDDVAEKAGPVVSSQGTPVNPNSRHAKRIPRPARPSILPAPKSKAAG